MFARSFRLPLSVYHLCVSYMCNPTVSRDQQALPLCSLFCCFTSCVPPRSGVPSLPRTSSASTSASSPSASVPLGRLYRSGHWGFSTLWASPRRRVYYVINNSPRLLLWRPPTPFWGSCIVTSSHFCLMLPSRSSGSSLYCCALLITPSPPSLGTFNLLLLPPSCCRS